MPIDFFKYQGAGNDFIMIDDRDTTFPVSVALINHLCDRRFGIGADGLILLRDHPEYDFEMVYFNSDGNLASMCGNGGRCTAAFAKYLELSRKGTDSFNFLAVDGPHKAYFKDSLVSLQMRDVIEIFNQGADMKLDTGSPHYVRFVDKDNIEGLDIVKLAKEIRYSPEFKEKGINVNFISIDTAAPNHIRIRTYERGVEDETLACGTGVVASALAYFHRLTIHAAPELVEGELVEGELTEAVAEPVEAVEAIEAVKAVAEPVKAVEAVKAAPAKHHIYVSASGGELEVDFDYSPKNLYTNIWLTGPAEMVFRGMINDQ